MFMDIIYEISYLLTEGIDNLQQTDMEYRKTRQLENRILEQLNEAVGKDMVERLTDVQAERLLVDQFHAFLCGLRLGVALLDL